MRDEDENHESAWTRALHRTPTPGPAALTDLGAEHLRLLAEHSARVILFREEER